MSNIYRISEIRNRVLSLLIFLLAGGNLFATTICNNPFEGQQLDYSISFDRTSGEGSVYPLSNTTMNVPDDISVTPNGGACQNATAVYDPTGASGYVVTNDLRSLYSQGTGVAFSSQGSFLVAGGNDGGCAGSYNLIGFQFPYKKYVAQHVVLSYRFSLIKVSNEASASCNGDPRIEVGSITANDGNGNVSITVTPDGSAGVTKVGQTVELFGLAGGKTGIENKTFTLDYDVTFLPNYQETGDHDNYCYTYFLYLNFSNASQYRIAISGIDYKIKPRYSCVDVESLNCDDEANGFTMTASGYEPGEYFDLYYSFDQGWIGNKTAIKQNIQVDENGQLSAEVTAAQVAALESSPNAKTKINFFFESQKGQTWGRSKLFELKNCPSIPNSCPEKIQLEVPLSSPDNCSLNTKEVALKNLQAYYDENYHLDGDESFEIPNDINGDNSFQYHILKNGSTKAWWCNAQLKGVYKCPTIEDFVLGEAKTKAEVISSLNEQKPVLNICPSGTETATLDETTISSAVYNQMTAPASDPVVVFWKFSTTNLQCPQRFYVKPSAIVTYCPTSRVVNILAPEGYDSFSFQLGGSSAKVDAGTSNKFAFELPTGMSVDGIRVFGTQGISESEIDVDLTEYEVTAKFTYTDLGSGNVKLTNESEASPEDITLVEWYAFNATDNALISADNKADAFKKTSTKITDPEEVSIAPCGQWVALVVENNGCCKDTVLKFVVPMPACPSGFTDGVQEVTLETASNATTCTAKGLPVDIPSTQACEVTWKKGDVTTGTISELEFENGESIVWTLTNDTKQTTCTVNVTVVDKTKPVCPADVKSIHTDVCVLSATQIENEITGIVSGYATDLDNCTSNANLTVNVTDAAELKANGTQTYHYTITDANTNTSATCEQTIEIAVEDFTIDQPTPEIVSCIDKAVLPTAKLPVVKDALNQPLAPKVVPTTYEALPEAEGGYNGCEGKVKYVYTYEDCAGHSEDWVYTYMITPTAPVVSSMGYETSKSISSVKDTIHLPSGKIPSAVDNCGTSVVPTYTIIEEFDDANKCTGTVTYRYSYKGCKNDLESFWNYVYEVGDSEKPVITTAADLTIAYSDTEFDAKVSAWLNSFSATDNGQLTSFTNDYAKSMIPTTGCGDVVVTFTAKDACENEQTATGTIKVGDSEKPVITTNLISSIEANVSNCVFTIPELTSIVRNSVSDNATSVADLEIVQTLEQGTEITETTNVEIIVTDLCGNPTSTTITVTVPEVMDATITSAESFCFNTSDGVIEGTFEGGQAPYNVSWAIGDEEKGTQENVSNINIENLTDGVYTVTVTDKNGCYVDKTATIAQLTQKVTLTADSKSKTYDGETLTLNTYTGGDNLEEGDVIANVVFSDKSTITDKGEVTNQITSFQIMRGDKDVTCYYDTAMVNGKLTVTERHVTLTSLDADKVYDGSELTKHEVHVGGDGFATGEGIVFTYTGTRTEVGSSDNTFTYELTEGTNASNYKFDVTFGTLTVNPLENVIVTITKNSETVTYDGEEHVVTGYQFESSSTLYTEDMMKFKGTAADSTAKGTDAGKYGMKFDETYFENLNTNFKDVTFVVVSTDSLVIEQLSGVVVTITENTDTVIYDGQSHTLTGYTVDINNALYKEIDFIFNGDSTISGTTVGNYSMPVAATDFVNNNKNFKDVEFVIVSQDLVIKPLENVIVTITKHSETVTYDGEEHVVTGYDFKSSDPLYIEDYIQFNGTEADSTAKGTDAGKYGMKFDETYFKNLNENFKDVTFVVVSTDSLVIEKLGGVVVTITEATDTVTFDGESHSLNGYTVAINNELYKESDFEFSGDATISGTAVGNYSMPVAATDFKNLNANFKDVEFVIVSQDLVITPLENVIVTITKHSETVTYDGEEHVVTGYDFKSSDPLYIEDYIQFNGTAADSTAKGTDAGKYGMKFDETYFKNLNENFKVEFVVISTDSLEISPLSGVTVTIVPNSDVVKYNGKKQTVAGYTAEISNKLYKESDFTFSGTASVSGTEVGEYPMELNQSDFANINTKNFTNVVFEVKEGGLVIEKLPGVTVTIKENADTFIYDGKVHTTQGFSVTSSDKLFFYTTDCKFKGINTVSGIEVGKYCMNLQEDDFECINPNFDNVQFIIRHDTMVILPAEEVIVKVAEKTEVLTYNGKEQMVEGYEVVEISSELYTADDFIYEGEAVVKGTNAGEYTMNLNEELFKNLNDNFKKVTFEVVPGKKTVIEPLGGVVVTIKENGATYSYDGKTHTVTGYTIESNNELYFDTCFVFKGDSTVSGKEVGEYSMELDGEKDFENIDKNFKDVIFEVDHSNKLVIEQMDGILVTVKKHGAVLSYNGEVQSVTGYDVVEISDPLYTVKDFEYVGTEADTIASRRYIGKAVMNLNPDNFKNINKTFDGVRFIVLEDTLTIAPNDHEVVTIHEGAKLVPFDGKEHEATGYTFTSASGYYTEESFVFSGRDTVRGTEVGSYSMGLKETDFRNVDSNYVDVKFVIVPDYLAIVPLQSIVVTIREHADTLMFNGKEQVVSGYDIESSISYYDAKDFTFSGDSVLKATHVGEYSMGLNVADFRNTNTNFTDVTFKVVPAVTKIVPKDVLHVTIYGNRDTVTYNGSMHIVEGYTYKPEAGFEFYKEFTFSGSAEAMASKVGVYPMELTSDQFHNTSKEYDKVVFDIEDGQLVVNRVPIPLIVTANSETKIYDGTPLTNDGFSYTIEALQQGDRIKAVIQASITDVGTVVNKIISYRILRGTEDVTDNYTLDRAINGTLTVVPRPITITSITDEKEYDGTPLTNDSIIIGGYGWAPGEGAIYNVTGSQLLVGESVNTFDFALNLNTKESNYEIEKTEGTLTVLPNSDKVIVIAVSDTFLYDGKEHKNPGYKVYGSVAKGDTVIAVVEGAITTPGKVANKVVDYYVMRGLKDVSEYYSFGDPVDGKLVVNPRRVTLLSAEAEKEYDGTELTKDSIIVLGDGWAPGEGATYTVTGSQMFPGYSENTFEYTLNKNTDEANYIIETEEGLLSVYKVAKPIDIKAESAKKIYDGEPLSCNRYTYTDSVLAVGDTLVVTIEGEITQVGKESNTIVDVKIMRGDLDVTDYYTIGDTINGVLEILPNPDKPIIIAGTEHAIELFNINKVVRVYDMLGRLVKINDSFEVYVEEYFKIDVMNQGVYVVFIEGEEDGRKVIVR